MWTQCNKKSNQKNFCWKFARCIPLSAPLLVCYILFVVICIWEFQRRLKWRGPSVPEDILLRCQFHCVYLKWEEHLGWGVCSSEIVFQQMWCRLHLRQHSRGVLISSWEKGCTILWMEVKFLSSSVFCLGLLVCFYLGWFQLIHYFVCYGSILTLFTLYLGVMLGYCVVGRCCFQHPGGQLCSASDFGCVATVWRFQKWIYYI